VVLACCCEQAALGYVSEQTEGFVDFDAVPADGASAGEVLAFVLSPEARELRPLLVGWLAGAVDLVVRDRWGGGAGAVRRGVQVLNPGPRLNIL
jgi:hypothetical protein